MSAQASPDTLIIFTTSPSGLGHIRVMNALIQGLSPDSDYTTVGVADVSAAKIHALGSRLPIALKITEFIQNHQLPERIVTSIYQKYFSSKTGSLVAQLEKVKADYPLKSRWIIISTHFALAYPVIATKKKLAKKYEVEIFNALIVTDDSPQRIWAAEGADIIFTPSLTTEQKIRSFLPRKSKTIVESTSFPLSPRLGVKMKEQELSLLENQLDPTENETLHISVPVSGAAVQLDYLENVISTLCREKFVFTVIGQQNPYTIDFFDSLKRLPRVQLSTSTSSHSTVRFYESSFYQDLRPACEITKPSEQSFKAILKPNEKGGVILLLTDPIGRQESDNLNFLIRNELLADEIEQQMIENYLVNLGDIPENQKGKLHYKASHWRALKLPSDPRRASIFIRNAKSNGLLYSMLSYIPETKKDLRSDGVNQIWNNIFEMLKYRDG